MLGKIFVCTADDSVTRFVTAASNGALRVQQ